jgi:hypothetical protein
MAEEENLASVTPFIIVGFYRTSLISGLSSEVAAICQNGPTGARPTHEQQVRLRGLWTPN